MDVLSLLDFSEIHLEDGTTFDDVPEEQLFNPPYFFGRYPVDKDNLLPIEEVSAYQKDMSDLYSSLNQEIVMRINRTAFMKMSLLDHSKILSRGEHPAGRLDVNTVLIEPEEVDMDANEGLYRATHEGVTYLMRPESSQMFHDIHDIACLLIFGVHEADSPKLGMFSPDFNLEDLIMEMKTYKDARFAINALRNQLHKYAQECIRIGTLKTLHGLIITESSYVHTEEIPEWVIHNCRSHASFISGLIKRSREIHSDSFDSDFFEKIYTDDVLPNLPQDLLEDDSDYIYVTEKTIEYCKTIHKEVPASVTKSFLKSLRTQESLATENGFLEDNAKGANRFGGRFTNIPILRRSLYEGSLMPYPNKIFSRFAWELSRQALREEKIMRTYTEKSQTPPDFDEISTDPRTSHLFEHTVTKPTSAKRSEKIRVDLEDIEPFTDYLESRGRARKETMKDKKTKEPSKWFSLSSDFKYLENFLAYEWFRDTSPCFDEFDDLNESDNGTGAKDLWNAFRKTNVFSFTDIISRIFSEVSASVQHYMRDGGFEVKEVLPGLFVIISSKGAHKPIFIQILHDKRFIGLQSNLPERMEVCGDYTYYEGFTVHPDRLSNWFNLTEKIFALSVVQAEIEKITFREIIANSEVSTRIAVILATMLEANEQTQMTLSVIRYAGMECLSGRQKINPFKILEKIDCFPRTLLGAWITKNLISSLRMMIESRPRMEFKSSPEELQQDSIENYICWMTMHQTKHLLVALNGWYVQSAVELVNGDKFQAAAVILEKLYQAEAKLRQNEAKDPTGEVNCGQRDYVFEEDFGIMHTFDREFVSWSCQVYMRDLSKKHPDFLNVLHKKMRVAIAKVTTLELCTLKSSVSVVPTDETLKGNVKSKVCINMLEHLTKLAKDDKHPFENIASLIEFLEVYGNYISLFRKVQKGTREILILTLPMRILQKMIETIAVCIASFSSSEMLTHPKAKEAMLRKHRVIESKMMSESKKTETSYSSCDATTWCQGLTAKVLFHFICPFLPEELIRPVGRIMNLMTSKKLALPKELLERFGNFVRETEAGVERVMQPGLRSLYEGIRSGECFTAKKTHLVNRSNMGQGILHTPSSLAHDISLCGLFHFLRKLFRNENLHFSHQVSSDDSGFIITLSTNKDEDLEAVSPMLSVMANFIVCSYPLFSAKNSIKSTVDCRNPIYEFNSVWQVSNFTAALAMKQVRACFALRMSSFDRRIDEMANNRRSLPNFGCGAQVVSCIQIAQARCHYKAIGLFSQYGLVLKSMIKKMRHPVFGLFPFEPEPLCGMLGGGYALHRLLQRDPTARKTQGSIYLHPSVSVKENGQPTLNIHFTPNSLAKFELFNKKLRYYENELLPKGWRQTVSDSPDILFDKYPKTREGLLCSIFRKIDSKKMAESFVTEGTHQLMGSVAYLFTSRCITVVENRDLKKVSFRELCDLDRGTNPDYEHRFDFNESYQIADRIIENYKEVYEVRRETRPSVRSSVKVTSAEEKLRNNLLTTALRFWSDSGNDTIVSNFMQYMNKYSWLKTTFAATMTATGKDAVGLLDLISVSPDKETTFKALSERPKGPNLADLLESYISVPRPGMYARSLVENLSNFTSLRMDINGIFTRICLALERGPEDITDEANQILNAAFAKAKMFSPRLTEREMWRGIISSTNNSAEKKFLSGLALFRRADMTDEIVEGMRDFSFYEVVGVPTRTPRGKVWGRSTLFLKTQGVCFRVEVDKDEALIISSDRKSLEFLLLPDNAERFSNHLKRLGVVCIQKDRNGNFLTAETEEKISLRRPNMTLKQECPNYESFKAPTKVDFGGFKSRTDNLPQTDQPSFRMKGERIMTAWAQHESVSLSDFTNSPNYLGRVFQAYQKREEDFQKALMAPQKADQDDGEELDKLLRSYIAAGTDEQRESLMNLSLNDMILKETSIQSLIDQYGGGSSDEDSEGFERYDSEEDEDRSDMAERMADLEQKIDPGLLKELSRSATEARRSKELLNKMPPGMLSIMIKMENDLEEGTTDSELISRILGLTMQEQVGGLKRRFD